MTTERYDEAVADDLRALLATQAQQAVVPPNLVDGIERRRTTIRRRRTSARLAAVAGICLVLAGGGFGVTRFGGSDAGVEVAAEGGPDSSIPIDRPQLTHCGLDLPSELSPGWANSVLWLEPGIGPAALGRIEAELGAARFVSGYTYVDTTKTYDQFRLYFADKPEVIDLVEPEDLPTSFLLEAVDVQALLWLRDLPGADALEAVDPDCGGAGD